ncbi:MAG TPA: glutaredoxin family protein [Burkholderiales bacterium]|nr:glutaredoxin family protein [Burkholderiales bacterium]
MRAYLFAAAALWIACCDAVGQTYRWVDDRGQVHYTQTPPPPQAKKIQRKDFRSAAPGNVDLPYATQVAAKNYPVTLYTQPDCGSPCDQLRASLVKRGVPFREVSVVGQREIDEMKKISGREDLPLLVVGSQSHTGFRESAINELLDTAGYPPAGPRVPLESLRRTDSTPASAPAEPSQQPAAGQSGTESK